MKRKVMFAFVCIALLCAAASSTALAASFQWNGSGTGANANVWSAKQNWQNNAVPTGSDTAVFGTVTAGSSTSPTADVAGQAINGIQFSAGAPVYSVSASGTGSLSIGSGGITDNATVNETITAPVTITASDTFSAGTGGTLTLSGSTLSLGANTLTVNGAGTTAISKSITGTGGLTKSGTGTLTLSGANTYSGATLLNGGTLNANVSGAFGSSSGVTVSGGLLNLNANTSRGLTLNSGIVNLGANISSTAPIALNGGELHQNTSVSSFGPLTLGGFAQLDLGTSGSVTFASATYSSGLLTVDNWSNASGHAGIFVTSQPDNSFLSNVQFLGSGGATYDKGAIWMSGGELVPVPEPQVYAAVFGLGLLAFALARRRLLKTA